MMPVAVLEDAASHSKQWPGCSPEFRYRNSTATCIANDSVDTRVLFYRPAMVPLDQIYGRVKNKEKCVLSHQLGAKFVLRIV